MINDRLSARQQTLSREGKGWGRAELPLKPVRAFVWRLHFIWSSREVKTALRGVNECTSSPLWVIRVVVTMRRILPVCPSQRTSSDRPGWSGSCQHL